MRLLPLVFVALFIALVVAACKSSPAESGISQREDDARWLAAHLDRPVAEMRSELRRAKDEYPDAYACRRDGVDFELCSRAFRGAPAPGDVLMNEERARADYADFEACMASGEVYDDTCMMAFAGR